MSREAYKKVYLPKAKNPDPLVPGPGAYTVKIKEFGTDGQKWGIQGRSHNVNDPQTMRQKLDFPGPGHYDPGQHINKLGKYQVSTIENSRAAAWSPSKRFVETDKYKRSIPGPGMYNPIDSNACGYILSNFRNYGTAKIKNSERKFTTEV